MYGAEVSESLPQGAHSLVEETGVTRSLQHNVMSTPVEVWMKAHQAETGERDPVQEPEARLLRVHI